MDFVCDDPLPIHTAPHFLNHIGVIPVVIMEFVNGGCLRTFLNGFRKRMTMSPQSVNQTKTRTDFVLFGKQIAEGMSYLVGNSYVSSIHCALKCHSWDELE